MKRIAILTLAALLFATTIITPAMAYQPIEQEREIVAQHRRGSNRRPPPPPPPRRHHDRGRDRRGSDWVGFGIGAALGAALGAGISSNSGNTYYAPAPAPAQPVLVYDPACNCYYYR